MGARKLSKRHSLSHGRPPIFQKPTASLSSKATRTIIRSHHQLQKAYVQAVKSGDVSKSEQIQRQIEEYGGLKSYQQASITGQSSSRGGDSSKILMKWLEEEGYSKAIKTQRLNYSMLEVGALSCSNACSRSGLFDVQRIDLNSQDSHIEQQDFMERPLPASPMDYFDIISLSLVLNYVPDIEVRGEMLRRTCQFLKSFSTSTLSVFPTLFVVLPAPCVENSRYLTEEHFEAIMNSIGYLKIKQKISAKLYYSLWKLTPRPPKSAKSFPKVEINPGKTKNNFCIVLR